MYVGRGNVRLCAWCLCMVSVCVYMVFVSMCVWCLQVYVCVCIILCVQCLCVWMCVCLCACVMSVCLYVCVYLCRGETCRRTKKEKWEKKEKKMNGRKPKTIFLLSKLMSPMGSGSFWGWKVWKINISQPAMSA